ncbi:protein-S-isoprenylcysteine O-methyltransferase [Akanthomyces lecanii RCEF 1005]|uniref:Protein-S-isoprenylcysteine O-methyltransferase n=1 Tax=Akanthomyces lecanii RCEF 1005 TaxID=1081108 RepID=A0A167WS23_CORDF|nr:protein-S-isoprenylcysteine O-methyltransferase [Akanthomyces lecanii RCEF 1005]
MANFQPRLRRPSADSDYGDPISPVPPTSRFAADLYPGEARSLSGIAMRAFCLGGAFSSSALLTVLILALTHSPLWRASFFLLALSAFHFLEFWVTARRNTLVATTDSFLLTANWPAYAVAHAAAFAECLVVCVLFPARRSCGALGSVCVALGLVLVLVGQAVRSAAMLHAGASFNHQIQWKKSDAHVLVTSGVYGRLRHPSYFGFFYWGLGTQLVMGNVVCFFAYAVVLWYFFSRRIRIEEVKLVEFFMDDYVQYRKRVGTWMPFI